MSPNKVHSDPSNSLHCPLAATAATAASHQCSLPEATRGNLGVGYVSTDIEVPLSEIIAVQSTVERDSVLSKGGRAGVGQDCLAVGLSESSSVLTQRLTNTICGVARPQHARSSPLLSVHQDLHKSLHFRLLILPLCQAPG